MKKTQIFRNFDKFWPDNTIPCHTRSGQGKTVTSIYQVVYTEKILLHLPYLPCGSYFYLTLVKLNFNYYTEFNV